jgi:hypothetical protein
LHVWNYSVINLEVRACCVELVSPDFLHGCNIELPMKIVNRLWIISLERGTSHCWGRYQRKKNVDAERGVFPKPE